MVSKGNEAKSEIVWIDEFPRLEDGARYLLDVLSGRCDIAPLAPSAVLNKNQISETSILVSGLFLQRGSVRQATALFALRSMTIHAKQNLRIMEHGNDIQLLPSVVWWRIRILAMPHWRPIHICVHLHVI
jgi:hypothetical protein